MGFTRSYAQPGDCEGWHLLPGLGLGAWRATTPPEGAQCAAGVAALSETTTRPETLWQTKVP